MRLLASIGKRVNVRIGIAAGLLVGKPLGITLMCFIGIALGSCKLPLDLSWRHIF
ncbi:Na+/H+ antiporter NhaA [Glaciimonas soli]|uniref:Uncharacterized protein n=1 Tax=Glaciimonas soli TaxID=2590999 RepID=A0A843YPP6_9BURK|nr:Na+/H+ antiporter NhaA [Glaciimonas soli]MQQ99271.1 hypothetical protein [Glaciimonas soli]